MPESALLPLRDWLLREGALSGTTDQFLQAFCTQMRRMGLPVARMATALPTLHPQIRDVNWYWDVHTGEARAVYAPTGIERQARFLKSPVAAILAGAPYVRRKLDPPSQLDFPILEELLNQGYTDYLAVPLEVQDGGVYVVTWASDQPGGFSEAQLSVLFEIRPALAVVFHLHAMRWIARSLLKVYLGQDVGTRVMDGHVHRGDVSTIQAVIWLCDLRGFTAMSEQKSGADVIQSLNRYFDLVGPPVEEEGGEILKFMGDALLAIFPVGAGFHDERAAADAALRAARRALGNARRYNAEHDDAPVRFGIALHAGAVMYGNIGTASRLDFTVIGPAVNLTSRIASLCKPFRRTLLVSEAVAQHADAPLEDLGTHLLPGVQAPQRIFGLPDE